MHPPSRARRILKWTGVVVCVFVLFAWVASLWCKTVILLWGDAQIVVDQGGFLFEPYAFPLLSSDRIQFTPHGLDDLGFHTPVMHFYYESFPAALVTFVPFAILPFWLLLLLTAIPTAWLWHRDRRRIRPGCCLRCGYDLTGNTSGVCSECGLAKPPPPTPRPSPQTQ